jgi:hypothetical protein
MRRARSTFQQMVRERGRNLRLFEYDRLIGMKNVPAEHVNAGGRTGTIAIFCQACDEQRIAVVIRGNLNTWIPRVKSVARDGFYKYRDGSVEDMPDDELYDSDPLFSN